MKLKIAFASGAAGYPESVHPAPSLYPESNIQRLESKSKIKISRSPTLHKLMETIDNNTEYSIDTVPNKLFEMTNSFLLGHL